MRKIKVGLLFGGRSAEHDVSVLSARNVLEAIDRSKYDVVLLSIDREGRWYLDRVDSPLLHAPADAAHPGKLDDAASVAVVPGSGPERVVRLRAGEDHNRIDVVFPILHGPYGEDGTVQGLLKLANLPFVGSSVLGSALGMDKDVMKRLLRDAGIAIAPFLVFSRASPIPSFSSVQAQLSEEVFVKPANLGSSVGITKATTADQFRSALNLAFQFDRKVIVEQRIVGREIECSVLGNDKPIASLPGEIVPRQDFYSYEAKYLDENGAVLKIPAELDGATVAAVQKMAIQTFQTLCCEGMARVDFFLQPDGTLLVNELNSIPGFTRISMFPKLWEVSGIPYAELIDRLIELALERHSEESKLRTSV